MGRARQGVVSSGARAGAQQILWEAMRTALERRRRQEEGRTVKPDALNWWRGDGDGDRESVRLVVHPQERGREVLRPYHYPSPAEPHPGELQTVPSSAPAPRTLVPYEPEVRPKPQTTTPQSPTPQDTPSQPFPHLTSPPQARTPRPSEPDIRPRPQTFTPQTLAPQAPRTHPKETHANPRPQSKTPRTPTNRPAPLVHYSSTQVHALTPNTGLLSSFLLLLLTLLLTLTAEEVSLMGESP